MNKDADCKCYAGWSGLAAAKTYMELHPFVNVVVLDAAETVGGVWAKDRLYPELKSNNLRGTYEYSDFPLDDSYGVKHGEHIPGHVIHTYLTNYAARFGVLEKIRFRSKVETAERKGGEGWLLTISSDNGHSELLTEKLIVATGLTSEPFTPAFEGDDKFSSPIFHSKDFLKHAESLKTARSVVVFGSNKSAWDTAYAYATSGVDVNMVMRESGHGPVWMAPAYVTPLKKWLEKLVHTRLLTWFSPCIWGDADGYPGIRNFFHATAFGRWLVDTFWGILGNDIITLNKYDKHTETKKLKPWSNPFFTASALGILNYERDFFDLVREGKIKVHIADIVSLSDRNVNLSNGSSLPTDALVCATGWRHHPPIKFLPSGIDSTLGLPHYSPSTETSSTATASSQADSEVLNRFPRLKNQPAPNPKAKTLTSRPAPSASISPSSAAAASLEPDKPNQPYRLYRFMVPPSLFEERSIAFAGALMTISTPLIAQTQALWISAYFDSQLRLSPTHSKSQKDGDVDVMYEAVLHSQWAKWRYPAGHGNRFPDFVFDALPYIDLMLRELGLRVRRKQGRMAEMLQPYGPEDYRGLVGEWRASREEKGEREEIHTITVGTKV